MHQAVPAALSTCALALFIPLAACGGGGGGGGGNDPPPVTVPPPTPTPTPTPQPTPTLMDPASWEIGPIIDGRNYSVGVPLNPASHPDGWAIELPQPDSAAGHVHYVTIRHGPLAGKSRIVIRYRIEAEAGTKILPTNFPDHASLLTLYFQRSGDNWSGTDKYEAYRWWAKFSRDVDLTPGEYEMVAALDGNWTAVAGSSATGNPTAFQASVDDADRVGFTLGGGDGAGHGVYATGPARLVVTDFRVE